jgi:hypothetical protein
MRMIRFATGVLLAMCLTGLMASGALAAAPELGRCEASATHTGAYGNAKCTLPSASHKGAYEWVPGPGPTPAFAGQGAQMTLETVGHVVIGCTGSEAKGSYTGEKTETVTITFTECSTTVNSTVVKCQSNPLKEGAIETSALEGELGFASNGKRLVTALDLKPKAPATTMATFTCGKLPEVPEIGTIEGSLIGQVKPLNRMLSAINVIYKQAGGHQKLTQLEGGTPDVPSLKLQSGLTTTTEEAGISEFTVQTSEEPYEVRTKG